LYYTTEKNDFVVSYNEKNDFAEKFKNFARYRSKNNFCIINILLYHQNNCVQCCKEI